MFWVGVSREEKTSLVGRHTQTYQFGGGVSGARRMSGRGRLARDAGQRPAPPVRLALSAQLISLGVTLY